MRLPTAFCLLPSTVASFLISPSADPLFSYKSVASFFKKAISSQLSASYSRVIFPPTPNRPPHCDGRSQFRCDCPLPSAKLLTAFHRGFVPDFSGCRSFVFIQIGGFVFQKSHQLSAVSPAITRHLPAHSQPTASLRWAEPVSMRLPTVFCRLLTAFHGGFVPDFSGCRSFVFIQIGGFVFQKSSQPVSQPSQIIFLPARNRPPHCDGGAVWCDCLLPSARLLTAFHRGTKPTASASIAPRYCRPGLPARRRFRWESRPAVPPSCLRAPEPSRDTR